jgi:microcystin-dependent protein
MEAPIARDGSGTYNLPEAAFTPSTTIESARVNNNFSDMASALTQSLSKDGQTVPTASQPMGGFKHTNVAAAAALTDYARADQVVASVLDYAADTGTATAYAIAPTPGITAYAVGQRFAFKAGNANSGADPTLAVNGLDDGIIYYPDGTSLGAGDIPANALIEVLVASATPTFHLQTPTNTTAWNAAANAPSPWTTGDVKVTWKTTADTGWVMMNDGSIGDASSAATTRANADTEALFTLLYTNISDTYAPVSGGRGANAAADFAAHKRLTLPKVLGRALAVAGAGSGLTSRVLGFTVGEETHELTEAEMPAHTHDDAGAAASLGGSGGGSAIMGSPGTEPTGSTGDGDPHNNMQPTAFLNVMVKL